LLLFLLLVVGTSPSSWMLACLWKIGRLRLSLLLLNTNLPFFFGGSLKLIGDGRPCFGNVTGMTAAPPSVIYIVKFASSEFSFS